MRYVIVGAGAIGGVLGGRLASGAPDSGRLPSGATPLLIARGEHGEVIASAGLRLRSPDDDTVVRVPVASCASAVHLQLDDVLVVATKTQSVEQALREWVDQPVHDGFARVGTASELLPVVTALNGVESERIASRYFDRVFGACVWLPGVHLTPGEVVVRIAPSSGTFIVGRFGRPATDDDTALLETLAADWNAASFRVFVVDDVMRWKHRKLLSNLGNALQALVGPSGIDQLHSRLVDEATGVYEHLGVTWPTDAEEEHLRADAFDVRPVPGLDGALGGSSWQSLERGGSIESDYLNGEIALLARLNGLAAPLNGEVQRLARRAAAAGVGTASMTVDEVGAALDRVAVAVR